ncbi:phospholipase-like protein [Tanacetum coccineum]
MHLIYHHPTTIKETPPTNPTTIETLHHQSLEKHLFREGAEPLSWCTRIKVAMGATQAIAFLHSTKNNVIYRDMKPSSILLDGSFVGADVVLAGFSITNLDIIGVIEDEEIFGKLSDDDAIRLYLLLALEGEHLWCHLYDEIKNLKERHGDEHYYGLFKDRNYFTTYTLSGFVFAFQIWILETFERCESWWIKDPKVIPRALGWSKKSLFTRSDYPFLFAKESRSTSDLRPTIAEYQSSWWIDNNLYFQEFVPRAPPIKEHHGLFETYLSKLEKARKRGKTGFMVSSIGGTTDNSVRKKWLNDLVIMELNFCLFKLETIIQVLSHERSDRQAKLKFTDEFSSMTSDLCDSLNSMFADLIEPADPDEDIGQDTSRVVQSMDIVWVSDDIERYFGQSGQIKCKFPWNDDYIVDRNFWLKLVCLDPVRKCWLTKEHIDLWVDYMWHVRPENSNWAMVSCYFVQLLLQNGMPLFYANGERYTTTWSEVFIPINETGKHWCLAQFHIMSGKVQLPVVPERANIFQKNGIDSSKYTITLAYGLSLDVDDPVDVALVYREKMVRFS